MFNSLFKRPAAGFETVNPRQILDWQGNKDVVFVDVRNPGEIAASGTVKGAVRIPLPAIDNFAKPDGSGKLPAADSGKAIVVFCASGMRSQSAIRSPRCSSKSRVFPTPRTWQQRMTALRLGSEAPQA